MIVGILGILKAGGAYVPVDPEYPVERIRYMLEDTAAAVVITTKEYHSILSTIHHGFIIELDNEWPVIGKESIENLQIAIKSHNLAYVIYTSGSTGNPKGVMNEHRGLINRLRWAQDYFKLTDKDAVLQKTTFCFDVSVWELLWPLLVGSKLVFARPEGHKDPEYLKSIIDTCDITLLHFVPSMLAVFLSEVHAGDCKGLKKILCSGEALNPAQVKLFTEKLPHVRLHNLYGPTEAAIDVTYWSLPDLEKDITVVPIGKPVANTSIYLLDKWDGLAPVGGIGEINIAGAQVARGYLNRSELSAAKFVKDPFSEDPEAKMYRTGDLGRWMSDGNLEYLGRIDDQVKIRGYRIELGEIESVLQQCESVKQAVVLARVNHEGNKHLIGYIVPADRFEKESVLNYLKTRLPEYMIPAQWVMLQSMPLTPNGKADKKALPEPDITELIRNNYVAPRNEVEAGLALIWKSLLHADRVGINDNFFELGGDSIITIQVVSRARRQGYELKPKDIFLHQTIASLSLAIADRSGGTILGEQGLLTGPSGLMPIQQWYFEGDGVAISHFNQGVLLAIDKSLTKEIVNDAVEQITKYHDALRFRYNHNAGQWLQEYGTNTTSLVAIDLTTTHTRPLDDLIKEHADQYQRSLDIEKGELMKVVLMQTPQSQPHNRLLIIIHHLAVDGVSWRIILDDLELLLTGLQNNSKPDLGIKSSSYRQWYEALCAYGKTRRLTSQGQYWEQVVGSYQPLRVDKSYSNRARAKDMSNHTMRLGSVQTRLLLQEVPRVYHTEINDVLLCALALTICEWSGTQKLVIGMEGHGRENIAEGIDTSRTVGWFTNLYPVLLEMAHDKGTGAIIKSVKEQLRSVPDKGLGYGVLKYINKEKKLAGGTCWDIVFNYLGQLDNVVSSGKWLSGAGESRGSSSGEDQTVDHKLALNGMVQGGELILNWSYSNIHYEKKTIQDLVQKYQANLELLIDHCTGQKTNSFYTPSDYGLTSEVSYKELDEFLNEPFRGKQRKDWIDGLYRLSGLQQGMLFHGLYDGKTGTYSEQFTCDLISPDMDAFSKSWRHVLNRHSILRSSFYYDVFQVPVQCVYREVDLPVTVVDLRGMNEEEQALAVSEFRDADQKKGFDFRSAPLIRVSLLQLSETSYRMFFTSHHILFDGWSRPIIIEEFLTAYELLLSGTSLATVKEDRYEDYIRYIENVDKEKQEAFWRNYLKGIGQSTLLPFIGTTNQRNKGVGAYGSLFLNLSATVKAKIEEYAKRNHLTTNTIMQGVWSYLLHQYTGNDEIVFGAVVSGRPDDLMEVEERVGLYINTLPLHTTFNNEKGLVEWLKQLQKKQVSCRQYQHTPLQDLQSWTGVQGDLFDSILVFENFPVSEMIGSKQWKLQVRNVTIQEQTNYPLTITVGGSERIIIGFTYNKELLRDEYITEIRNHFENVLLQIITHEEKRLGDIRLLSKSEEHQLLAEFNDTHVSYQKDITILDLFALQVKSNPGNIAVAFEQSQLTYKELNDHSNQLAHYLINKGVKKEELVPICIERGLGWIIAILGVLKSGGVYVPIDPEYPADRINYMLEDSGAAIVIASKQSKLKLENTDNIDVVELDEDLSILNGHSVDTLHLARPDHLAYVIYTSGSTGRPKGAGVFHQSIVNLITWYVSEFSITEHDNVLIISSLAFDLTQKNIFAPLSVGGTVVMPSMNYYDSQLIKKCIHEKAVTLINCAPHAFYPLVENDSLFKDIDTLRLVVLGGEPIHLHRLENWISGDDYNCEIVNSYGPTECTDIAAFYRMKIPKDHLDKLIPIGRPNHNVQLFVLDKTAQLLPIGLIGEIHIGGDGVGSGYLRDKTLTSLKFIPNPFSQEPAARLYKTGDLGRWLPDGNVEYLGRMDDQVKIRGYRIEPGEIENLLRLHEQVDQAIVLAKEDHNGSNQLVGYIVANGSFDRMQVVTFLKESLPDYMVPALWVVLEAFPLTPNGKIDKKALPEPDTTTLLFKDHIAPRNETENNIARIWKEVLHLDQVGIHDSFFELGGHSLLAMRVISLIRKRLEVEVDIKDLFIHPTIASFAWLIQGQTRGLLLPSIETQLRPARIPLSFSQERLWFIDRLDGSVQYHTPTVLRMKGNLNREALAQALRSIIKRHEVLRTVFLEDNGKAYQDIKDAQGWELILDNPVQYGTGPRALQQQIQKLIQQPFDLSKDYMLRAHLLTVDEQEHVLVVTIHHIASDGWSISVLVKDVIELYTSTVENREADLLPLTVQYADYAIWQRTSLEGEVLDRKLQYWKEKLRDTAPLQLLTDKPRPAIWSTRGAVSRYKIDKELSAQLQVFSQEQGCTVFMTLLAAFKVLLYRYTGQQDICVGTPIAGRQQQELESLIGFFVNTLALRSEVNGDMLFTRLLQQVRNTTLKAFEHQDVPFEKVVDAVVKERDMSRNPLFQVLFVLQNTPEVPELRFADLELSLEIFEHTTAKFDIAFFITESPQGLNWSVEYSTELYHEETIARLIVHYKELLQSIVKSPHQQIDRLPMLTGQEEHQILVQFNDTAANYGPDRTVIDLFEDQVLKTPQETAVIFEELQITYHELNQRSNQLAHYLRSRGVAEETLVPICVERSLEMIVGILGILKAGAAYVPVDPEYPEERIRYMLEDTRGVLVVSTRESKTKIPANAALDIIEIDEQWPEISRQPSDNLQIGIQPHQLAYVIYTSGSTGKPKGVMIEHKNAYAFIGWCRQEFSLSRFETVYAGTSICFDLSVFEIFYPLSIGKRIRILENGLYIGKYLSGEKNVLTNSVPSVIQSLLSDGTDLSNINVMNMAGEPIPLQVQQGLNADKIELRNLYGPTEDTTYSTVYRIRNGAPVLIGKPISNSQIYILNKENKIVPIGIAGEICIGGDGLARGYFNRPELTAEKFIVNPFGKQPGSRLYKTGDLGRWRPDGNIEYLGRLDYQVKIRGYRIELGEIESVLQQCELVSQAVVLAREEKESPRRLVGYIVPDWQSVKVKERELYYRQVSNWKELYETEYEKTERAENIDQEFNIIGWNDSFTGNPIPSKQMKEWLQDIVEVILSKKAGRVLEIGCGTGLIYYQLAGKVYKYIGTDFSRSSINQINERVNQGLRNYGPTELHVCAAHEIALKEKEEVDTIVVNSVVQYFPGEDYLTEVIEKSISLLKGKGRIIIGDVRDNRLLRLFKSRLLIQKFQDTVSEKEFKWAVDQEVLKEEELCFSPDYFYRLQSLFPQIRHVDIQWKHSSYINELTLYRFTVVLYVGMETAILQPQWLLWKDLDTKQILNQLQQGAATLAVKDMPNPRLWKEKGLSKALQSSTVSTVGDLVQEISKEENESETISHLLLAIEDMGYSYKLLLDEDPLKINLLVEQSPSDCFVEQVYSENGFGNNTANTNIPLFTTIGSLLQKDIRTLMQQRLPEYMVPSELIMLSHMPLTGNGKIDRTFLTSREDRSTGGKLNYEAPRTEEEQTLANIWQGLLGIERVGINDDFFELGGHSLLATRAVSAVRKKLNVELVIKDLFQHSTIAQLALHIGSQNRTVLPAIKAEPRDEYIPLSFSQERLWFIHCFEGSIQYHIPAVLKLQGKVDKDALDYTLQTIVNRHEILRTVIREEEGKASQFIKDKNKWTLQFENGSGYQEDQNGLKQYVSSLIRQPFDLSTDYMLRATLITLNEQEHLLVVVMHHIASDGWSLSIIVNEVAELYEAYLQGRPAALPNLEVQYADFSIWQRRFLQGELLNKKIDYWKKKLEGVTPLQLPADFARPVVQSTRGSVVSFKVENDLLAKLKLLSQQQGTTLFMTLLSAFKVLLHNYSGQQDICVGTSIAGRQQEEIEGLIGFFINTLALRSDVNHNLSFTDLLQKVKTTTLEAYENQEVPFEKVVDAIAAQRDISRNPIFQVLFALQNTPDIPGLRLGELTLSPQGVEHTTAQFDLTFRIMETSSGLRCGLEYCTDLYNEATIVRMVNHFSLLLGSIVKEPQQLIGKLQMLNQEEKDELLLHSIKTPLQYPDQKSIVDLFEEQVTKTPDQIAVVFEDEQLSYLQLNERANQLAHYLKTKGVTSEVLVPICVERSLNMMVGILGILKAGGVYVPLDPKYPGDRIRYMLEDTAAVVAVSSEGSKSKLQACQQLDIIELDGDWSMISKQPKHNLATQVGASQLAYIIYTSGSTGKPKGVMVEHRNVVSLVKGIDYVSLHQKDILLSTGSFSFDATTFEYWGMLLNGGQLIICTEDRLLNSELLKKQINNRGVTKMWFTSSWFNQLVETDITVFEKLKTVLVGGEKLSEQHIRRIRQKYPSIDMINGYGPTENTTFSLTHLITDIDVNASIPIGEPLNNRSAYVLNGQHQLVPIGVAGEICLGGAGLSRGYLNRADLTSEKFIVNPFSDEQGSRLYKTGDLGRWLPGGNIQYLGRIDEQVKIRGYRIELGEIASVLQQSDMIRQAVVLVKTDKENNKRLIGYVVPEGYFDKESIVDFLKSKLPEYMVPAIWIEMETLPLTNNGKVNKKNLPDPDTMGMPDNQYVSPRNELETKLVEIWQDLLELERVGVEDNFFELGGHSLLAIRLISVIRKELSVEIPIGDVFEYSTITSFAQHIESRSNQATLPTIKIESREEYIPLSFSQERLWFIDKLEGSVQYHLPTVLRLKGKIDWQTLEFTLQTIVNRHEVLRTVFMEKDGQAWQNIKDKNEWKLALVDGSSFQQDPQGLKQQVEKLIRDPFNLAKDHMLRAALITLHADESILVATVHHIASDGWSTSILVKEVVEIYQSRVENRAIILPPLDIQYADFAIWQRNYLQGEVLDNMMGYWKEKLQKVEPLALFTDYVRPAIWTAKGTAAGFNLDKELSEKLNQLSQQQGATLFMTLLSALKVLLHHYSGQQDICVGTGIAGRQQQELEGLIGFFINTIALRSEVNDDVIFSELLQQVKKTTLQAYEHQDVPFEKVVDATVKQRDMSRNPVFQVMFVLQNTPDIPVLRLGDLQLFGEGYEHTTAQFDLSFSITETPDGMKGSLEYCTDLYSAQTIGRMLAHFKQLLDVIVKDPHQKIGSLSFLTQTEESLQLLQSGSAKTEYPHDKSIVDIFEEQVKKTPNNIALVFEEEQVSYQQLNDRSNQLAHYLRSKGVGPETMIPLFIERSLDLIVGVLAILKAGAAYVPLDTSYPEERIQFILQDTKSTLIVCNRQSRLKLRNLPHLEIIEIDSDQPALNQQPVKNPQATTDARCLAYIIYTSGSTGTPKGVMVEHGNVVSLVKGIEYVSLNQNDILLSTGSVSFDATTFEYWGMLLNGGQLVLCTEKTLLNNELLKKEINSRGVNIVWFTSSWFNQLVETDITIFETLQTILVGGEKLSEHHILQVKQKYPSLTIVNGYGPTENTTFSLTFPITAMANFTRIPIGRPLNNRSAYIMNQQQRIVPIGAAGEIYLGGAGLARGYLNQPALTKEKFIIDPFSKERGARLYRTGDLGRWLPDGNIEYLGRMDDQVKIRGYRIELGEIENVLQQSEHVRHAVVLVKQDKGDNKRLVGYIVPDGSFEREGIVSFLRNKLPEYMIPSLWVELQELPLTQNGKVNKRALPDTDPAQLLSNTYVAPRNELEVRLVEIWQELLNIERVGIEDNFFELGGHSLLAMRMVSYFERDLLISVPIHVLFKFTCISDLSKYLDIQAGSKSQNENTTFEVFDI